MCINDHGRKEKLTDGLRIKIVTKNGNRSVPPTTWSNN